MDNHQSNGLTRRETLKRGLKLTGTVLWATPVVQAIGMSPAFAQAASGVLCEGEEFFRATYDLVLNSWQTVTVADCSFCKDIGLVDGSSYFAIDAAETTVTLIAPGCRITSLAKTSFSFVPRPIGICLATNGGVADDGQSAEFSSNVRVTVCFTCCVDD